MKRVVWPFVIGALFGAGLLLAGMTQPSKVIAFLDVGGAWDPTLAFVMAGAIAVHVLGLRLVAPALRKPSRTGIDVRVVAGSAIFGVGWGLAGYCPGPALVSLGEGGTAALVFVGAATAGMLVQHLSPAARVG